jgi:hypothetical protein
MTFGQRIDAPGGGVGAEHLLAPRIPDLERTRLGVMRSGTPTARCARPQPRSPARRTGRAPEFRHEVLMQCDAFGVPDLVPVVVDHPFSTIAIDAMPHLVYI